MTKIDEILSPYELSQEIKAGYVTSRAHKEFPELRILNYTPKAQYDNHWNDVTLNCRGLIYNHESGEVIARPFKKMFNYGDIEHVKVFNNTVVYCLFDKADGSLGIEYTTPNGDRRIATRGSFHSEQADYANANLLDQLAPEAIGCTNLYEIIYPENRIVLDYGDDAKLVELGCVFISTGIYAQWTAGGPGMTVQEVVNLPQRENAEGYILWVSPYEAVKLKQADYVEKHRIVFGLTPKKIFEAAATSAAEVKALMDEIPDELHEQALNVLEDWGDQYDWYVGAAFELSQLIKVTDTPRSGVYNYLKQIDRLEFAPIIFAELDNDPNKAIKAINKLCKPSKESMNEYR